MLTLKLFLCVAAHFLPVFRFKGRVHLLPVPPDLRLIGAAHPVQIPLHKSSQIRLRNVGVVAFLHNGLIDISAIILILEKFFPLRPGHLADAGRLLFLILLGGLLRLFLRLGLALGRCGGGGHGRNGHGLAAKPILAPHLGGQSGGDPGSHHIGLVLQPGVLHHGVASGHPALGLLHHMGQLMAQHVHTGAAIQQDIGTFGYRLDPKLLGNMAPADTDIGKIGTETGLKLLPQSRRHGLRRASIGHMKHLVGCNGLSLWPVVFSWSTSPLCQIALHL